MKLFVFKTSNASSKRLESYCGRKETSAKHFVYGNPLKNSPDTHRRMKMHKALNHSVYITTVSSYSLLSTLLTRFKLVYRHLGQSNMHSKLDFCPRKDMNVPIPKVKKVLQDSLDLIPSPSPSVKIQIMGGKVCFRCKGKTLLGVVNKLLKPKSMLTSPSNVLP